MCMRLMGGPSCRKEKSALAWIQVSSEEAGLQKEMGVSVGGRVKAREAAKGGSLALRAVSWMAPAVTRKTAL